MSRLPANTQTIGQRSDINAPSNLTRERPAAEVVSDPDLVARCQAGDSAAFETLYERYASRLYAVTRRMVASRSDADDLLQEIFLLAFRRLATFRGEASVGTWLYRLAMNRCLDHVRSRSARIDALTGSLDERAAPPPARYAPGALTPTRIDLERAIERLPEGCRAAFLLHDVQGFDHREVGEILGIAEGTSKSQVHKARLRIRAFLTGAAEAE
jgi:RNA polymerase sigma-70 factor (ECF subfamily)